MDLIVSVVLLVIAVRIVLPLPSAVYTNAPAKLVFSTLVAFPAVWLLLSRSLRGRKRALLGVLITYVYCGILALAVDWTRLGSIAALLGLAGLALHLYVGTAREVACKPDGSSPSSPPSPEPPDGSSRKS